ncbi:MAG: aminotransferase class I/II-fold pyridoxal phosphate-dependent enzyme [Planctomycetes bacterium]|nr:aminotransferase class I/II-fold pyridoxal phosphate-dependent enzyme [Planctomycetota bacterium]
MGLNALAVAANEAISADCPVVGALLSDVGKALYFPKGILTQSAEAKSKAHRYNATIGIATEAGSPMYLDCVHQYYNDLEPKDLYPYAPSPGKPELRAAWAVKQRAETPSLGSHVISSPVVTNALTHGLSLVGDLFVNSGDTILMPDKLWGNYRLTWELRLGANIKTFPFFTDDLTAFNVEAFKAALVAEKGKKVILVLNFPNNPSGYSPLNAEAAAMITAIKDAAEAGTQLVVICDDAYYGMFYDEDCATESMFGALAQIHNNVLAIKVDGATKEEFVWGLRVGFLTYGTKNGTEAMYKALEQKTGGAIRGSISNVNHPGQTIVLKALESDEFRTQQAEKVAILQERALTTQKECSKEEYADCWDVYPFNAGYFMCLRIKGIDAETLRVHLLEEHGLGTISIGKTDLRVAFSCLENAQIEDVFKRIAQGVRALQ